MLNFINDEEFSTWKSLNVFKLLKIQIFEKDCKLEAEKLRHELISLDYTVTLAEILTKDLRQVAGYLSVDDMKKSLKEIHYDEQFSIYSVDLKEKIKMARELVVLLNNGYESLKHIFGESRRLPKTFLTEI